MDKKIKYFIEHHTLKTWLVYDGRLTNNAFHKGIITHDEKWKAEKFLKPQEPTITSDYSGKSVTTDYAWVHMHNALVSEIAEKNNGADLYKDFIISEHIFLTP